MNSKIISAAGINYSEIKEQPRRAFDTCEKPFLLLRPGKEFLNSYVLGDALK
jgi:hypothetical protein